jgi:hypothetical protein
LLKDKNKVGIKALSLVFASRLQPSKFHHARSRFSEENEAGSGGTIRFESHKFLCQKIG